MVGVSQQAALDFMQWFDETLTGFRAQAFGFNDLKSLTGGEIYEWCELGREAVNAYSDPGFAPENLLRLYDTEARSRLQAVASPRQMRYTLICFYFLQQAKSVDESRGWVQEWAIRLFWGYRVTELFMAMPYCEVLLIGLSETDKQKRALWEVLYERVKKDIRDSKEWKRTLSVLEGSVDAGKTGLTGEAIEVGDLRGVMDETLLVQVGKCLDDIEVPKLIEDIVSGKAKRDILLPIKRDFIDLGRGTLTRRSHEALYASPEDLAEGPTVGELLESGRTRRILAQLETWCKERENPDLQEVCDGLLKGKMKTEIMKQTGLSQYMVNEYLKVIRGEAMRIADLAE